MYFDTYDAAQSAAIKQSKGQLGDCKLYIQIRCLATPIGEIPNRTQYKIGFTPDNPDDAYVYNGEIKTIRASEAQQEPAPSNRDSEMSLIGLSIQQSINETYK